VRSGDTISTRGSPNLMMSRVVKREDIALCTDAIDKEVTEKEPGGHILTAPVAITKAEPDDML
jgi:hypothetical protein